MLMAVVLRVMPDDNSCLFRAFSTAALPTGDDQGMPEIRALIAGYIQADPEKYTKAVLEQLPDDYCRWIQTEDAWGGYVEMDILAKHFDIQICSIDVQVSLHPFLSSLKPTNSNSLSESTAITRQHPPCVYSYTPESTTIRLSKAPPSLPTPKQTTHLISTSEYGSPPMRIS